MRFVVKIDKDTIKKNPDAGRTVDYCVVGRPVITYHEGGSMGILQPVQILHRMAPSPQFLYQYLPTRVSCEYCSAEFNFDELESDGDEEGWSETVCPKCHIWNCCEVEFESLSQLRDCK